MEKILFSNFFNQTEYLRTMAKLGHNTFGLRVLNENEICSFIIMKFGVFPKGTFISDKEENYIYYSLSKQAYNDAKNIKVAVDSYRDCVVGDIEQSLDENLSDDFPSKKTLIRDIYSQYKQYKKDHSLYDKHDLINFIINSDFKLDIEVEYYEEMGISKLFLTMLNKVFARVNKQSLINTFGRKEKEIEFVKAYGKPCEADYVLSTIMKNQFRLDECQIILLNSGDYLDLYRLLDINNIPYTSTIGTPIISTNAGKLLSYLFKLENLHFGVDGYKQLFNCSVFKDDEFKNLFIDKEYLYRDFKKYAGWLRLGFDSEESLIYDDLYPSEISQALHILQEALHEGRASFIARFLHPIEPIDLAIIEDIKKIESTSTKYGVDISDLLKEFLSGSINKKISDCAKLHITNLNSAFASLRKYNFIVGLDSDFPGGPKENYLIFDEEYKKTGSDLYISNEIVKQKDTLLRTFIDIAESLYISYPYFEIGELEDNNPSSVVFDIYPGDISKMKKYGYEDISLSENKDVFEARIGNKLPNINELISTIPYDQNILLNKEYSPSSIHSFFQEDQKLSFILSSFFNINIEEEDDPFVLISQNDKGTLIHNIMEYFDKNKTTYHSLTRKAYIEFNKFILQKPPLIPSSIKKVKEDFDRLIENLYEDDPGNHFVAAEVLLRGSIEGINFKGKFDRLEKDKLGHYILVDYKTGKNITHNKEDSLTCMQGLIYAYLIEHADTSKYKYLNGVKIDRIEFRYPENRSTVIITYNEQHLKELQQYLRDFKQAIINHDFSCRHLDGKTSDRFVDKYEHLVSLMKEVRR